MKDRFSQQSQSYKQFRPEYPPAFFEYIKSITTIREKAWDCATGNGQVAKGLSTFFKDVFASDVSENQLSAAHEIKNITYSKQPAEDTDFENNSFDLIVVAQAIHWFNFDQFYREVRRTLKPDGKLVILGYGLLNCEQNLKSIIDHFYQDILGSYWDPERQWIDANYQTIPFPFEELPTPTIEMEYHWTLDHLIGYLGTWSAVKRFAGQEKTNPVDLILGDLNSIWPENETKSIQFPLLIRTGTNKL